MKSFAFILAIILSVSCSENHSQNSITQTFENRTVENTSGLPQENSKNTSTISNSNSNRRDEGIRKDIESTSQNFGLSDLKNSQQSNDDVEIRLYQFSSYGMLLYQGLAVKKSVLVVNKINGVWSAKIILDTVKFQKNKSDIEKRVITHLGVPKSGWDNFWQTLINEEILTLSTGEWDGLGFDTPLSIVETRANGEYRFFHFHSPYENHSVREGRQIAKIIKIIHEELGIF